MAESAGKIKGVFAEHRDALLGGVVICGGVGIIVGILVFLIAGIGWALGCGTATFLLLSGGVAYILLSETHGAPTEGDVDDEGYRHGRWIWNNADGQLLREDNFVHGVKDGPQVRWHENGNKQQEMHYRNGKLHGTWTIWYENGNKAEEDTYEDGRTKGQHIEWYRSGQKKKECCYHDYDVPHGDWTTWHDSGTKRIEARFEYGTPVGRWTEWDSEESIQCQQDFVAGIQRGNGRRYFSDVSEPQTTRGNVLGLILVVLLFAFATYKQMQPFPLLLTLFVIVFIHELGHFAAAKLVGIPIRHFVLGVGPRLFGFHFGQTSYEVRLLPIMGHVKAYELRRPQLEYVSAIGSDEAAYQEIDPSDPTLSAIELVSRPRRLIFFLAGVAFNFGTVLVVAFAGWMHEHPDSSSLDAAQGTVQTIWALMPVIGNSKDYLSGFRILMATGVTTGTIGLISLVVACINLVPIPPLDGYHVLRVLIACVTRREVPERYLLPLNVAGGCLVMALLTMEAIFMSGDFIAGIRQIIQEADKPAIVGQVESAYMLGNPVNVLFANEQREVRSANNGRLLALTLKVEGEKTLLTEEYVAFSKEGGNKYKPLGVLFGKLAKESVFTDVREAKRVALSQATGDTTRVSVAFDLLTDARDITARSLFEPFVTLLYEVGKDDGPFELQYDDITYDLTLTDHK